jgi:hypothetical protein
MDFKTFNYALTHKFQWDLFLAAKNRINAIIEMVKNGKDLNGLINEPTTLIEHRHIPIITIPLPRRGNATECAIEVTGLLVEEFPGYKFTTLTRNDEWSTTAICIILS